MSTVKSQPYAWPYHGQILPKQTALAILNDAAGEPDGVICTKLAAVVSAAKARGIRVIHMPRAGLEPVFRPAPNDLVVERPAFGGFTGTSLDLVLQNAGLRDLLLAGFPAELGADCTMREANDLGYECLLLSDCCTGLSRQTLDGAVSSVQMSGGIFGVVATAEAVIAALQST